MSSGNQYAPNGTLTVFVYAGVNSKRQDLLTKEMYDITADDTLLSEGIPGGVTVSDNPLIKYAFNDLTIHRRHIECKRCRRPVMSHVLIDTNSAHGCRCKYIEST